jgi:hypothetical protein
VLLKRIVPLGERLQPEAPRRVADGRAAQDPEAPIHVLSRDRGLDLLDPHEVLLVERAQAIEPILELIEGAIDLLRIHGYSSQHTARRLATAALAST